MIIQCYVILLDLITVKLFYLFLTISEGYSKTKIINFTKQIILTTNNKIYRKTYEEMQYVFVKTQLITLAKVNYTLRKHSFKMLKKFQFNEKNNYYLKLEKN